MEMVRHGMFFASQGWYPADEDACRKLVDSYLESLDELERLPTLTAGVGIVPHAGWAFSGRLADMVFGALARRTEEIDTVVLFGGHLGPGSPSWVITSGLWPTPLGDVAVDGELATALAEEAELSAVGPGGYEPDNTIELQMPFVRALFPEARLVVAGVPAREGCALVGKAAVEAAGRLGRKVVTVGSTDLTHYGPNYGFMPRGLGPDAVRWVKEENDRRAVELMVGMDAERLLEEALERRLACCPGAACAAVGAARTAGASKGHVLETLTSYDIRPGDSFVGYAAVVY